MRRLAMALSLLIAMPSSADPATRRGKVVEERCPAPALCTALASGFERCAADPTEAGCGAFLRAMTKSFGSYDCQRTFEGLGDKPVPAAALWLCQGPTGSPEAQAVDHYVALLASLEFKAARRVFGSPQFRQVLDGAAADDYIEQSLAAERIEAGGGLRGKQR
jgi:hypothetical protein